VGVHSPVAGEQDPGVRPLQGDLGDVLGGEVVPAAVVGQVQLDVEAELGQPSVAEHPRRYAVHVEARGDGDLLPGGAGVLERVDHLGQAQQLVVLGRLDGPEVLVGPPAALAHQSEKIDVLVDERMVLDGLERGHGEGLSIVPTGWFSKRQR
jgi:hypothetical protein